MADIERIKADTERYGGPFHPYKLDLGEGGTVEFSGLSLRDYFAGQVLSGFMSAKAMHFNPDDDAAYCYRVADAMLKARKGEL